MWYGPARSRRLLPSTKSASGVIRQAYARVESVDAESGRDAEVSTAAAGGDQVPPAADGHSDVDASRKRAVRAGSRRNGMGDEGVADERWRDQVDEISGPTAPAGDCHHATARDAFRLDAEPRRRSGDSPREDDCNESCAGHDARCSQRHHLIIAQRSGSVL